MITEEFIFDALQAEQEGEKFPIPFDIVWQSFGYTRKTDAMRALFRTALVKDQEYCKGKDRKVYFSVSGLNHFQEIVKYRNVRKCPQYRNRYLYVIASLEMGVCKIGISNNPEDRLKGLQTGFPFPLVILEKIPQLEHKEREIHQLLSDFKLLGEWFDLIVYSLVDWSSFY